MQIIELVLLLGGGLFILWKSGDYAVRLMLRIASLFGLTTLFSGFVLMAVSTGIPELSVVLNSVWNGTPAISAGDIIGSNVIDITLVLGIAVLFGRTIKISERNYANIIMILIITMLVMFFVFSIGRLTWIYGILLIVIYCVCLALMWKTKTVLHGDVGTIHVSDEKHVDKLTCKQLFRAKVRVIIGFVVCMIVVMLSSKLVVLAAVDMATMLGMPLEVVGTTIVAIGTSLPEISLSVNAVLKRKYALALGNSLGSVLEQGTLILGILSLLAWKPIDITPLRTAAPFMFAAFALILWAVVKRKKINRLEGWVLIGIFIAFITYQLVGI